MFVATRAELAKSGTAESLEERGATRRAGAGVGREPGSKIGSRRSFGSLNVENIQHRAIRSSIACTPGNRFLPCDQKISAAVKFKLGPSVPTTALP
jgi:hypothetical protein